MIEKAVDTIKKIKQKEIKCEDVVSFYLERIKKFDKKINAFLEVFEDDALKKAKLLDEKINKNLSLGKLAGIPVAIKDNILIKGKKTTCASKILENYIAVYNATVIEKLLSEDAILIGKTNLDEFAMGSSTENSAFKKTANPWNLECVPGGSSGGSAACVSANFVPLALGSDTGGSIRQPASFCGVYGFKPTYGRVSRFGLVAFASSLDQIGAFARNVEDLALITEIISGYDCNDSTSVNLPVENYSNLQELKELKIGLPKEYFYNGVDEEVLKLVYDAVKVYEKNGGKIKEITLPHTKYVVSVYYIIAPAEASANLARYDGIKYGLRDFEAGDIYSQFANSRNLGFGPEVKRRIMLGSYTLSSGYYDAYYLKAQKVRTLILKDFENAFKEVDFIITPTSPTPAFKFGEKITDPLKMYLSDVFTISCNLAGLPGISVPCGFTKNNLPVSFQILGKHFEEKRILDLAYTYELKTNWSNISPEL